MLGESYVKLDGATNTVDIYPRLIVVREDNVVCFNSNMRRYWTSVMSVWCEHICVLYLVVLIEDTGESWDEKNVQLFVDDDELAERYDDVFYKVLNQFVVSSGT